MRNIEWLSDLCISEISFINTYIAEKSAYPMRNPCRNHHGFLYTLKGEETYNFRDKQISCEPDSLLYIPKGEKYTIDFKGEKSVVTAIEFETLAYTDCRPFCIKTKRMNDIKMCFADAEKAWLAKKADSSAVCKSLFYKITGLLIRQEMYYLNSGNYDKISTAVDYLHNHYTENEFRINTLFEISRLSPRYFETLFFKEFKMTPKEYINSLKIEQAKELLKNEKYSIGKVASQLGYGDIYHFSKTFKAKTGYAPSAFRSDAVLNGKENS